MKTLAIILLFTALSFAGQYDGKVYPHNFVTGKPSAVPMHYCSQGGGNSWQPECKGVYLVQFNVTDGETSDSEVVRIVVHGGWPLMAQIIWMVQDFWLGDNMAFDLNENGVVNWLDYAELVKDF